jgi:flagellar biosynthetic protein FliQ
MTVAAGLDWFRTLMWTATLVSAPVIVTGLVVGLIVAVLQAATQVNDSALGFVPKAVASGIALVIAGPWMLSELLEFTTAAFRAMGAIHP